MLLRSAPVAFSSPEHWGGVTLQRFHEIPSIVDIPAAHNDVLVTHLSGPFLAEVGKGTPSYQRRWIVPGQVGINPAGRPVRRELKGKADVVLLHIPPAKLRETAAETFGADPTRVQLTPTIAVTDETSALLVRLLLQEADSPQAGLPLMVGSLISALMVHMLRHHSSFSPLRTEPPDGISAGRVRRVVDHMRAHLDQRLSLADLARLGGLSPSRFVRAFHRATGDPPHRLLVKLRIEQACHLLEHTDLLVTEVGLRCGFDQPSHFSTMFRKLVGASPTSWRRERRG